MSDLTAQTTDHQLLVGNFTKTGAEVTQLSDPLTDTPMLVTLDQLKPYEHNPRIMRNPLYDEIKASIRERGLDAPPTITRRPGETLFTIRNGGNTRLSVLQELWAETKEERFFKIHCLFKPWQNEITALTGHLAENELQGKLTFIERALGVVKVNEIYAKEFGVALTQKQLAQKLTADGYPVNQARVSQMQEVVTYLLPVIPDMLYGGLSRAQIEKIIRLRRISRNVWAKYNTDASDQSYTFDDMFVEVLSAFNQKTDEFDFNKYQDELTARMAQVFECSYDTIALDLGEKDKRQRLLETPPSEDIEIDEAQLFAENKAASSAALKVQEFDEQDILSLPSSAKTDPPALKITRTRHEDANSTSSASARLSIDQDRFTDEEQVPSFAGEDEIKQFVSEHVVSPMETTARLDAITGMVHDLTGESSLDFKSNVIRSVPVQAGGLYPISDIWHISPTLDDPQQLKTHIGQLLLEISEELGCGEAIQTEVGNGLGFICAAAPQDKTGKIWFDFLAAFEDSTGAGQSADTMLPLVSLLTGIHEDAFDIGVLSDAAFVKLMRVLRLIRRLREIQLSPPTLSTDEQTS